MSTKQSDIAVPGGSDSRRRKFNAAQLHQLFTEEGEDNVMLVVRGLHTSRPSLGEVSTLIIFPKYEYSVMFEKEMVYRFRELVLSIDPGQVWENYNYLSHSEIRSKFTAVFIRKNGEIWDQQWDLSPCNFTP